VIRRIVILSACLLLGAAYIATASKTERVPAREPLASLPFTLAAWRGQNQPPMPENILAVLGVDEYIDRAYQSDAGRYAGLYVGYYESQRQGDTIHSPLNCLPGAGWEPVSKGYLAIPVATGGCAQKTITVNRYVVEKGLDRQVVFYWYQSHGRVVANEYRSKIYMVLDAVRLNRTDAAMVRVITPRIGEGPRAEDAANQVGMDFVKAIFPMLDKYIPS
jgi:EpsI family protein